MGVVYSPKAGAECRSCSFFPNTLGSQSPGEKKASLNMWLIYHAENKPNKGELGVCARACVCVRLCVIKGIPEEQLRRDKRETEGEKQATL